LIPRRVASTAGRSFSFAQADRSSVRDRLNLKINLCRVLDQDGWWLCCVDRARTGLIAYPASVARLDRLGEFVKRGADANAGRMIDDEFVVSAPQVLLERVAGGDRAGRADLFESAHWTEPVFEAAMIGFDDVVRTPIDDVPRAWEELVDDAWVHCRPVSRDLDRS
jgi:hypothetical protein